MRSLGTVNNAPLYPIVVPSTKKKVKFRPFLVKEERALLTASESEDSDTMYATLESVVKNCLVGYTEPLTTFDVEYLFVHIRSKSVGETSDVAIKCECGKETINVVNLGNVKIVTPDNHKTQIQLSDEIVAKMRYPSVDEVLDIQSEDNKELAKLKLVKWCVDTIYADEDVYVLREEPSTEVDKFFDSLTSAQYKLLTEFVDTIPHVELEHNWTCPACSKKNTTLLKGIFSFF